MGNSTRRKDVRSQVSLNSWATLLGAHTKKCRLLTPGHASSIARYFVDLNMVVQRCWDVLENDGIAVFVIGNTSIQRCQGRQCGASRG